MVTLAAERIGAALGGKPVLHDVSAHFSGGALVGILGPNGAGKSTLIRALLGLLPATGSITLDGCALGDLPRAQVARTMAYLPQGQTLHWPLSVERLVALGRLPHLAPFSQIGPVDRTAVARALARAEVTTLTGRTATELSGGERARVLLARALAVEAPVLVVDEPLASLDPAHQLQGMEILRAEADAGVLVLAVLHDLGLAARFCDRVLLLDQGQLIADGRPDEVLTRDHLRAVYGVDAFFGTAGDLPLVVPIDRVR